MASLTSQTVAATLSVAHRLILTVRHERDIRILDHVLLQAASRVRQPLYLRSGIYRTTPDRCVVPFLDGNPGEELDIRLTEDTVVVVTSRGSVSFGDVGARSIEIHDAPPARIALTIEDGRGGVAIISAPFGMFPVPLP